MRLLLVVLLALAFSPVAIAQDGNTTDTGNATPDTNETPVSNETATNETPAEPAPLAITLEGVQEGSAVYFRLPGETTRNPTLHVAPGQKVTFTFRSVTGVHNLNINGQAKTTGFQSDGDEATFEWTAPTTPGNVDYWCDPHKSAGMQGKIQVGGAGGEAAPPEPAGPVTVEIEGVQEGSALYFRKVGDTARNPTLTFAPGQKVTFVFRVASGVHNLNINGEVKTKILGEGETETIEWTAPAAGGSITYWCDPHKSAGMQGKITVGTATGGGGGGGAAIEGDTVDLGQFDPACAGQKAPAAAARGEVGLPLISDYVAKCNSGDQTVVQERPAHVADWVIPLSWVLIGLGVVGVVWVHKYYKP